MQVAKLLLNWSSHCGLWYHEEQLSILNHLLRDAKVVMGPSLLSFSCWKNSTSDVIFCALLIDHFDKGLVMVTMERLGFSLV